MILEIPFGKSSRGPQATVERQDWCPHQPQYAERKFHF